MVIRQPSGAVTAFRMNTTPGCPPARICEALAMLEAINWLTESNFDNVLIETDSMEVEKALNQAGEDVTEFGMVIQDCRRLLKPGFLIRSVRRSRNEAAHLLARHSRFVASPTSGVAPPIWLNNALCTVYLNPEH
ncbi:hypothetical protein LINPERHAP2_LOCUS7600 [Linum perenne]